MDSLMFRTFLRLSRKAATASAAAVRAQSTRTFFSLVLQSTFGPIKSSHAPPNVFRHFKQTTLVSPKAALRTHFSSVIRNNASQARQRTGRSTTAVGLQTARGFATKPALDVALNLPLGQRALWSLYARQQGERRPAKSSTRRSTSGVWSPSIGSLPSDLSSLSQLDSLSISDVFQKRPTVSAPVRYSLLFPARPDLDVDDASSIGSDSIHSDFSYTRLMDTRFLYEMQAIHRAHKKHRLRLRNALDALMRMGMMHQEPILHRDGDGREFLCVHLAPRWELGDVQQAMGVYDGDRPLYEVVDWAAEEEGEVGFDSVAEEDGWVMPHAP